MRIVWKSRRRGGRPRVNREICDLIRQMSRASPLWGAPRIHGELLMLGIALLNQPSAGTSRDTAPAVTGLENVPAQSRCRSCFDRSFRGANDLVSTAAPVVVTVAIKRPVGEIMELHQWYETTVADEEGHELTFITVPARSFADMCSGVTSKTLLIVLLAPNSAPEYFRTGLGTAYSRTGDCVFVP